MTMFLATMDGIEPIGPGGGAPDEPLLGVIPGDDVALHRLVLLARAPQARLEEARMRATDLSAEAIDDLHVAVGPADAQGASWVGVIARDRMAGHVAHFEAAGAQPQQMVPAALLLEPPGDEPSMARLGERVLLRTDALAGLVEPGLVSALAGGSQLGRMLQLGAFAPGGAPDPLPLDLLQGEFAPRVIWWRSRRFQLAAAGLLALCVLLLLTPLLIDRARTAAAIAGYDKAVVELTTTVSGTAPADAAEGAAALAAARRAAEGGMLGARLTVTAGAVEMAPGTRLERAILSADGRLALGLNGPPEAVTQVRNSLLAGPFVAEVEGATVVLGDRRAGVAANGSPLSVSMLRLVTARQDAALLTAARARGTPLPPAGVEAALVSAGLAQPGGTPGSNVVVPSARGTVLLPLIADLERQGARFGTATIVRNGDETLSATLGARP